MILIHRYLFRRTLPSLLISFIMFTLFFETIDLVNDLVRYLLLNTPLSSIFQVQLLFLPTCMIYALPLSILFSISFTLGEFNFNNELIALYTSGVSLLRFVWLLIILSVGLSVALFFFHEELAIDSLKQKNEMKRTLLNQNIEKSNTQVSLIQFAGKIIYYAEFYDDSKTQLNDLIVVLSNDDNVLEMRIDAKRAKWNETTWVLEDVNVYAYDSENKEIGLERKKTYTNERINANPRFFRKVINTVDELRFYDALQYLNDLRSQGVNVRNLLTDVYSRIPFALSPFIVMILGCLSGNLFKKNALLMSLLSAIVVSILYYVTDLIGNILAVRGVIPPLLGAWLSFFSSLALVIVIYQPIAALPIRKSID